jgi:hypothetical protein
MAKTNVTLHATHYLQVVKVRRVLGLPVDEKYVSKIKTMILLQTIPELHLKNFKPLTNLNIEL